MMIASILLFLSIHASATEKANTGDKALVSFKNKNGYSLQLPECWIVKGNSPEEFDMDPHRAENIFLGETSRCARPKFTKDMPNGLGVGVYTSGSSKEQIDKEMDRSIEFMKKNKNGTPGVRELKMEGARAVMWIEKTRNDFFRWKTRIVCPSLVQIEVSGPAVDGTSKEFFPFLKRISEGQMDPPEPEKKIIESIRCEKPASKRKAAD